MFRFIGALVALSVVPAVASAVPLPERSAPKTFLVKESGLTFLGADGEEKERLDHSTNGALSPDGRWLACVEFDENPARAKFVIRSRDQSDKADSVPLIWAAPGSGGCLPVWAADSKRVLIGENGRSKNGVLEYAYRVYDLPTKKLRELKVPDGHWVTGWSPDGKRLLTTARTGDNSTRIAWVNSDGTGKPEFITSEDEVAYHARLSPDGKRILCLAGPKAPQGQRAQVRLYAINLASKKRTLVDQPGETHGYCWSPDGSRIAYTWQRSLAKPAEVAERETLLITCDADGSNRKTVTKRKYKVPENSSGRSGVVIFFEVLDWR